MKNGFTLIELLAVIVILAIIALIAVPIVLNIINESKESSLLRSAEFYLDAVEYTIADAFLYHGGLDNGNYLITPEGDICKKALPCDDDNTLKVEVNGDKPTGGTITIDSGNISDVSLILDEKTIVKDIDGTLIFRTSTPSTLAENILKQYGGVELITEVTNFSKVETGIYKSNDDLGISYYFRGNVENNYVKFGKYSEDMNLTLFDFDTWTEYQTVVPAGSDMYWRIVRINGDGTIRLIYDGISATSNSEESYPIIGKTAYNYSDGDAKYISYEDSSVKQFVDSWYNEHLKTTYEKYISDSIFCNDRSNTNMDIYYNAYDRIETSGGKPSLMCQQESDKLTVASGLLSNPIGLITADEFKFLGTNFSSSYSFWTMTPYGVDLNEGDSHIFVYFVNYGLNGDYPNSYDDGPMGTLNARPVINLKADVEFTGTGTKDNPYVIITE